MRWHPRGRLETAFEIGSERFGKLQRERLADSRAGYDATVAIEHDDGLRKRAAGGFRGRGRREPERAGVQQPGDDRDARKHSAGGEMQRATQSDNTTSRPSANNTEEMLRLPSVIRALAAFERVTRK